MKPIIPILILPMLPLALSSCGRHGPESSNHAAVERPTVTMACAPVAWSERPLYEPSVGTVRPFRQAEVSAKLTGRILQMLAVPGRRVKEGELLAEIDAGELRAAVERARSARDQAKRDFDRTASLLPGHAISQAEFEQAQARLRSAVASTDEAERMLANAKVCAPFGGTVTRKDMDTGDLAMPGKSLFAMEDSARLRLESHVAESLAGAMQTGDKIRVTVDAAGVDLEGVVAEISPSADTGSRTFLVKIDLPSHDLLRAGQFGRAHIPRGRQRMMEVPEAAVITRGQMEIAFVLEQGRARMRLVRTGQRDGGRVTILSGLDAGETLLLAPEPGLRDGDPVQSSSH